MTRKAGFYAVLPDGDTDWTIAEWDNGVWRLIGNNFDYNDNEMQEINETPIKVPMIRKPGFYWVRFRESEWIIGQYTPTKIWFTSGTEEEEEDLDFEEIDEKQIIHHLL
jgi:hypothetical protein